MQDLFEIPTAGLLNSTYLAKVESVKDPDRCSRVQVRLLNFEGANNQNQNNQNAPLWARVAVPFSGNGAGAFLLPGEGDEVLVQFVNGDPRLPIVVGGLWNGSDPSPAETLGGSGDRVDRWAIVGRAKTQIAIIEERDDNATISLKTPQGVSIELTDANGGKIELKVAQTTITLDPKGMSIQTPKVDLSQASQVKLDSGQLKVNSAMADFSGLVKASVSQATTVIAQTYTPGAGNVW